MTVTPLRPVGPGAATAALQNAMGWATQSPGYSESTFYTASRENGEYGTITLKMPEWIMQFVIEMVHSRDFPAYKNPHDVIRDALRHRIEWLRVNGQTPRVRESTEHLLNQWDYEQETTSLERNLEFAHTMLKRTEQVARACQADNMWITLLDYLDSVRQKVHDWEGNLRIDVIRVCDTYESQVPEQARKEWHRLRLRTV